MIFSSKEEYKEVFEEYYNPLCNFAFKFVNSADAAEDIVQEVFVQMWQKRNQINIKSGIKSYLFQSTRNKAIETIRRSKLKNDYVNEELYKSEKSYEIEVEADNYLLKEQLNKSIRQLPPKCQQIFVLSKMNGLTYGEIAEELNLSVKTVENQIGRGLKLLRGMLTKMRSDNENK
ncbi:RNA polymerase sigma-70 factor [Portibacter lacus]|uniref:DNA-directed RNA polymerase sigma-70 factor n=1 Tax=Portibacter lacus TaxID=1099794 RepID=A0AA37SUA2_9BACT|nr:RNA polymerase sigma-70 factor [Portibacter lacus]GLR18348.1 DNA-directed RNA polymerase sigma-70 factor [Portibacter lacus]